MSFWRGFGVWEWKVKRGWKAKGADFITEPLDNHGWEMRCYIRDPDGYIIEVGQSSPKMIEMFGEK